MRSVFARSEDDFRSRHVGPRWGMRTLGFLALAFVAVATSQAMGGHTIGTLGSLLFGLVGAGYCTYRGLQRAQSDGILSLQTGAGTGQNPSAAPVQPNDSTPNDSTPND